MLATKTQDAGSGDVGMMEVARNQPTKILGIFSSSSTSALMREELDAIDILENPRLGGHSRVFFRPVLLDLLQFALSVESDQFSNLLPVSLGPSKTQFLFKRLFQDFNIAVLAEDQGHHQPIISGADLTVRPVVTQKRAVAPPRDIGRSPIVLSRLLAEGQGIVSNVAGIQHGTFLDRLRGLANEDTIHEQSSTGGQICGCKFVLGRNVRGQNERMVGEVDLLALAQVDFSNHSFVLTADV